MPRHRAHVPNPSTIASSRPRKPRQAPSYAIATEGWTGPVERIANPIQRSLVVQRCPTCREYFTERDRFLGFCRRDGHPYLAPANA